MPLTLGSNIASLKAQRSINTSGANLARSSERLASGQRINRASDDAAGLSISQSLRSDARIASQAIRNVSDGLSMISIAEGALNELENITIRIQELAEQAGTGTISNKQRSAMDEEAQALRTEYNRIIQTTTFNGTNLLYGESRNTSIQAGVGSNAILNLNFGEKLAHEIGDGSFGTRVTFGSGSWHGGTVADFNGDGNPDAIAGYGAGNLAYFQAGNGDGTFRAGVSIFNEGFDRDVRAVDLNDDGKLDLVGLRDNAANSYVRVLFGNGDGTFQGPVQSQAGLDSFRFSLADLNNDGEYDLVTASNTAAGISIMLGNGNGTFRQAVTYTLGGPGTPTLADFNEDGNLDVVSSAYIHFGNGDGTFGAGLLRDFGLNALENAAWDVNNDGHLDVLTSTGNGAGGGVLSVSLGNGNGTFRAATSYGSSNLFGNRLSIADFNEDGAIDVVVGDSTQLSIFMGNSNGSFSSPTAYATASTPRQITIADVDNDGVLDLFNALTNTPGSSLALGNSVTGTTLGPVDLSTRLSALNTLDDMNTARNRITAELGNLGGTASRLQIAMSNLETSRINYLDANSRILDADIAAESAELVRNNLLQQVGASVLAQANQIPALALSILGSR